MKNTFITAIYIFTLMTGLAYTVHSADASGNASDYKILEGEVKFLKPEIVTMKTSQGMVDVNINEIDVDNMDVDFLQIGDTMSVQGHFADRLHFDAEELVDVKPFSS